MGTTHVLPRTHTISGRARKNSLCETGSGHPGKNYYVNVSPFYTVRERPPKRLLDNCLTMVRIALDPQHVVRVTPIPTRHQAFSPKIRPINSEGVAKLSRPQEFWMERETGLEPATFSLGS